MAKRGFTGATGAQGTTVTSAGTVTVRGRTATVTTKSEAQKKAEAAAATKAEKARATKAVAKKTKTNTSKTRQSGNQVYRTARGSQGKTHREAFDMARAVDTSFDEQRVRNMGYDIPPTRRA